jgi:hypothetical protein
MFSCFAAFFLFPLQLAATSLQSDTTSTADTISIPPKSPMKAFTGFVKNVMNTAFRKSVESQGMVHSWTYFPYPAYTPETSLIIGAQVNYLWKTTETSTTQDRPSNAEFDARYTLRNQWQLEARLDAFFDDYRYRIFGNIFVEQYPLDFYGVGNTSLSQSGELFTPFLMRVWANASYSPILFGSGKALSVGGRVDVRHDQILVRERNGFLESSMVTGFDGGWLAGVGGFVVLDLRDNIFSTTEGFYAETALTHYSPLLGSSFACSLFTFDVRGFVPIRGLSERDVLAVQGYTGLGFGNVPFYALPTLGGAKAFRGVLQGQFSDNVISYAQTEYRVPFADIFQVNAFVGLGATAQGLERLAGFFANGQPHVMVGGGLRLFFDKHERLAGRLDVASVLGGSPRVYIGFSEAF